MDSEVTLFENLVAMACPPKPRRRRVQTAKRASLDTPAACLRATHRQAFLEELIDACVLAASEAQIISAGNRAKPGSLYFPDEAASKRLLFIDQVSSLLGGSPASATADGEAAVPPSVSDIESFITTANAPTHPIRQNLGRLVSASPDLFAVIKQEGKV